MLSMPQPWKCSRQGLMGFEQPCLLGGVPAHSIGDWNQMLFQPRPFCDSTTQHFGMPEGSLRQLEELQGRKKGI